MDLKASYFIEKLNLIKHPEGGYYKEIYRSDEIIDKKCLPTRYGSGRSISTSIYYLLENDDFSAFHRLKSDEIWHFYKGTSVIIYVIDEQGVLSERKLGDNPEKNETFQLTIKRDHWFAARVNKPNSFVLVGCTVAPGFNFVDFEMGERTKLIKQFPDYKDIILKLTHV